MPFWKKGEDPWDLQPEAGAKPGSWLLNMPFCFRPLWDGYGPWVPRGAEAVAAAVLLFLGLGLCVLACWRQRKRELLS